MGSLVVSVSAGAGCYRHIRISDKTTLYRLHKAILDAFAFEDDRAHAFFLDNRLWSPADAWFSEKIQGCGRLTKNGRLEKLGMEKDRRFKYLFDFGEEWVFQCRVLRELEEETKTPVVIRAVGEPPLQYPEDGEEDWLFLPDVLPQPEIEDQLRALPLAAADVAILRKYFEAGARLYGVVPVMKLREFYNRRNKPVSEQLFLRLAAILQREEHFYFIVGPENFLPEEEPDPYCWDVVDSYLLDDGTDAFFELVEQQGDKPFKELPQNEFLRYADRDYYPPTPQNAAMRRYLFSRGDLPYPQDTWLGIQTMIELDFTPDEILNCVEHEGLVVRSGEDLSEFMKLFQALNNTTAKQVNRGYTPEELRRVHARDRGRKVPENQLSLFDIPLEAPALSVAPSRNGPCPCGSGKKYKRCCGKDK